MRRIWHIVKDGGRHRTPVRRPARSFILRKLTLAGVLVQARFSYPEWLTSGVNQRARGNRVRVRFTSTGVVYGS